VHAWLEDRGPARMYLVGMIDDATNTLHARFVGADSTEQNLRVLWSYLERYGRPQAVYTDKAGMFQPTLARGWKSGDPEPKAETQIGRALRELGIEWIAAHSPQAKGRVERCFGTLQDRLVKALRKAKVRTLKQANAYLEQVFLPLWNQRFARTPASAVEGHRRLEKLDLSSILSVVEQRGVANDYTVQWRGVKWQIPRAAIRPGLRGSRLRIEQRLDATIVARIDGRPVALQRCDGTLASNETQTVSRSGKRFQPAPGQSRWMDRFRVNGSAIWRAYRQQRSKAATTSESPRDPAGISLRQQGI